jgi:dTDP-4-amino-4,6-dideoxygalactose transaminase
MKYIFNSLGSNYSLSFVLHALVYFFITPPKNTTLTELDQRIKILFPDFEKGPYYFYKGRDALEFVLTAYGVGENEPVLTQAFTCHALEAAIRRTGAIPAYVDIDPHTLNPTIATLEKAYRHNNTARIVIIQHTLGVPADIEKIRSWCSERKLVVIEDLAQAVGGVDKSGVVLGTHADAIVFSFGRDKIIDAYSGGACLLRKKPVGFSNENYHTLTSRHFKRDHGYPLLTYVIRTTYPIFVGKVLAYLAKVLQIIQSPIKPRFEYITAFPSSLAALAIRQFDNLPTQITHRRKIARLYFESLRSYCPVEQERLERGSNLRFPLFVENPQQLVQFLARKNIYLGDRWYRQAVDSGSLQYFSKYRSGSCPEAEQLAAQSINLPTHQNITLADATRISSAVREYLE